MLKHLLTITAIALLATGCSSLKQIGNSPSKNPEKSTASKSKDVKFLDDISATPSKTKVDNKTPVKELPHDNSSKKSVGTDFTNYNSTAIESASALQIKYAILLNTEVEEVKNIKIYEYIDQWYGTKYCMGGTTKKCIDCSAFMQYFFASIYGITLPRTAKEQYKQSKRISRTSIKEGDLLFFNTRGGISHVGVYLQNNKFAHASSSDGVTISDMFDPYWVRKLVGVGRIEKEELASAR